MRLPRTAAVLVLLTATLAGCGGSSKQGDTTGSTTATGATATATTSTTAAVQARAALTPAQLLAQMRTALARVKSYHVEGTSKDKKDGGISLVGDVSATGAIRLTMQMQGRSANVIAIGKDSYIKANASFWKHTAGSNDARVIALLAGRWIAVPSDQAGTDSGVFKRLLPKQLALCTGTNATGIERAGTGTLAGQPVVKLSQDGKEPGNGPGVLSIAAIGPALPLEITQTGPITPGGKLDPRCDDPDDDPSTTLSSAIRFSRYDEPVTITAPPNALDLSKLAAGSSTPA